MENNVRVRFAPSPTGPLHLGGVRTALYNYLFAKKHNGTFILRIEDTDQTRFVPGAEEYIIESLNWAGIPYDEGPGKEGEYGPYKQSSRKEIYKQYAEQLVAAGKAYYAFDTAAELDAMRERAEKAKTVNWKYDAATREYMRNSLTLPSDQVKQLLEDGKPYVIRLLVPRNEEVRVPDLIRGNVVVLSNSLDDKVLFKSDGMPTYHLANVVDDYLMKISHVIRGEEWLPSAPTHVLLYQGLGWEEQMPKFAHLPLILKPDGHGKLSKRDGDRLGFPVFPLNWVDPSTGDKSSGYREAGYLPSAFLNILALLGWHPSGDNKEIFTLEELIQAFSLDRVSKSGAKFDPDKAKWFNHQALKHEDNDLLANKFLPVLEANGVTTDFAFVSSVCGLIKEKATLTSEFWDLGAFFFVAPSEFDAELIEKKWDEGAKALFEAWIQACNQGTWTDELSIKAQYEALCTEQGIKPGQFMQLLRMAISGHKGGPDLWAIQWILGSAEVSSRIGAFLALRA